MLSNIWVTMLTVGAGGFAGAIVRYAVTRSLAGTTLWKLPAATLLINLSGSYLLGWLWGHAVSAWILVWLGTGFMGAFTTFSTMNWEADQLAQTSSLWRSYAYLSLTYAGGIGCACLGYYT